jgi:hypothetical protein
VADLATEVGGAVLTPRGARITSLIASVTGSSQGDSRVSAAETRRMATFD